ncbi:hypothetical protein J2045_002779 [Peteryoungia aggregata LMG 23059]|uniref:Phytase-like domain-containing protein n=1 Tax=Peteryoungia aggregata LMG 23059 TaxID=1368425 RepID=A0ABU0G8S1_9HYPH|nr:esterase-like activity of phytase family protein [Peteryoungia aggregata]MDQ0421739.1 hypothetical protein [Peteryoungia aggregata LMG 23059]
MTKALLTSAALFILFVSQASAEEKAFPAKLVNQAILPANTIIAAPADAPAYLKTSGKFSTADRKRADALGSVPGKDGVRLTGLAMSKDGTKLYGMLEGPLYLEDGSVEKADGLTALRIIELDAASKAWTGKTWLYPLSEGGEAIGDFNMIDATTALVIERDNGAGVVEKACADPKAPAADCFAVPAKHKRIYKIEMTDEMAGKAVRKIGYIDLMKIEDPDNKKRQGGGEGFYDMPFVTIENVDVVDPTHIIVGNDNNLPFSAGRALDKADDSEFVLLEVGEFLAAK